MLSDKKGIVQLEEGDIVLGCLEEFQFGEHSISLKPEDLLIIYSDGITEAINENEEELGEDEMIKVIVENQDLSLEDMTDKIMEKVKLHSGDNLQYDDMTIVLIKRRK